MNKIWTEKEEEEFKIIYIKYGLDYCAEYFNRTTGSIRSKASLLNLKRDKESIFTEEGVNFLKENYEKYGPSYCAGHLKLYTIKQIKEKAYYLGLSYKKQMPPWIKEEDDILINHYQKDGIDYCLKLIKRTRKTIHCRAAKLGLAKKTMIWTKEQYDEFKTDYPEKGVEFCMEKFQATKKQIMTKAHNLNLKIKKYISPKGYKICSNCKKEKMLNDFVMAESNITLGRASSCRICMANKRDKQREANPILHGIKQSLKTHKQRGCKINFEAEQLLPIAIKITHCEICKRKLTWTNKKQQEDSFTLDRLSNSKEMNINDIGFLCRSCNTTKSNRSLEEFEDYNKMTLTTIPLLRERISKQKLEIENINF